MRAFVAFLLFVQSPEGLLGVFVAPDSPVIGHANGGPVLVKEGKGADDGLHRERWLLSCCFLTGFLSRLDVAPGRGHCTTGMSGSGADL